MPEPQEYIEPPPRGFVPPSAADAFGLAPIPMQPRAAPAPPAEAAPAPADTGIQPDPAADMPPFQRMAATPSPAAADVRADTVKFWMAQGAPEHVAQGIADRVNVESGFKPDVMGDRGTSGGLYQHHADRL